MIVSTIYTCVHVDGTTWESMKNFRKMLQARSPASMV